jgi:putative transposase
MLIHNNDSNLSPPNPNAKCAEAIASTTDADANAPIIPSALSPEAQLKLKVIESLLAAENKQVYATRIKEAAVKLDKSERTIRRMVKKWEQEGLVGLTETKRTDKGTYRVDEDWQEFILKTYKEGNKEGNKKDKEDKNSKRMTRKQVFIRVEVRAEELGVKPPSHMTVYRVLQPIIDRQQKAKSIRSPGWKGERLSVKTRDGKDLSIDRSNQVWQCDHTRADVLLVDSEGKLLGRPWLTTVIDSYSRCIMGINLGYDAPSSQVVSLALRHAILPKQYDVEYGLHEQWGTYGLPKHFYTDGGKDFRSDHIQQVGIQLGFLCHLRDRPSEGGIVERPFGTLNTELFSLLPGYTGSNVQKRPETAEADACLTLRELERRIVRYFVDNYNQRLDARMGDQTRFQRWESGLIAMPKLLSERDLDICLMKQARRQIQRGGYLQFENLMYRGENLGGYGGESVVVRFDPRDITTILIYRREGENEVFLARAHAQDLETEELSLDEAKAMSRKIREKGKEVTNRSILSEVRDRDIFVNQKPTQKERKKAEQAKVKQVNVSVSVTQVDDETDIEITETETEWEMPELIDYEDMRQGYGF